MKDIKMEKQQRGRKQMKIVRILKLVRSYPPCIEDAVRYCVTTERIETARG
jgi:hypothetical protein